MWACVREYTYHYLLGAIRYVKTRGNVKKESFVSVLALGTFAGNWEGHDHDGSSFTPSLSNSSELISTQHTICSLFEMMICDLHTLST